MIAIVDKQQIKTPPHYSSCAYVNYYSDEICSEKKKIFERKKYEKKYVYNRTW
jgi:hypothetical protein